MIQVNDLYKSFDGFMALDGLNITVPTGAVYGLVGPNGAGKSTLIRHVAGIYRQDAGQVLVEGQPVYENPAMKARIAYIPDEVFYYTQSTIKDMMQFYRSIYPSFSQERFQKLGEVFALSLNQPIRKMSKGMQKQAAFWLALCRCPDYIVLDEPVDGLDPVMRRQVWSLLLSDVAENGSTVLVSSHNLRELEDVCDHVGIMKVSSIPPRVQRRCVRSALVSLAISWARAFSSLVALRSCRSALSHSCRSLSSLSLMGQSSLLILGKGKALDPIKIECRHNKYKSINHPRSHLYILLHSFLNEYQIKYLLQFERIALNFLEFPLSKIATPSSP